MQERLNEMLEEAKGLIEGAGSISEIEELRVKYLGKKGQVTEVLKSMGKLPPEEKKELGKSANMVKGQIDSLITEKTAELREKEKNARLAAEKIDVTEPGKEVKFGVKHPITQIIDEVVGIFKSMGYSVYEGPDVDTVFNTFDGLNSPPTHPSRDMTDTFYVTKDIVLRPHTSSAEINFVGGNKSGKGASCSV